ncbi:lytic murein transglycosylase [Pannonibacter sp. Q-1]
MGRIARKARGLAAAVLLAAGGMMQAGSALADAGFQTWVRNFWPQAQAAGINSQIYNAVFTGMTPDPDTVRLMSRQSEFVKPVWDYLESAVSPTRIENGQKMLREHAAVLREIEARYGVQKEVVLAVWGMETNYGSFMGGHDVIRALATLAYEAPRRREFWQGELVSALGIIQAGHVRHKDMIGSWAGAMGHTQFMPSSWKRYAADFDGDGRRDIWTSIPDALASTANYLKEHGWQPGKTWGYEVSLPRGFDYSLADDTTSKTLAEWSRLGVVRPNGRGFPRADDTAVLVLPAGAAGPSFLMLKNFSVIKRYNNATAYALAVGHLADRIRGGDAFAGGWAREHLPLNKDQTMQLQAALNRKGFQAGEPDGLAGPATRRAIRAFQKSRGLIPDGYASVMLLSRIGSGS